MCDGVVVLVGNIEGKEMGKRNGELSKVPLGQLRVNSSRLTTLHLG